MNIKNAKYCMECEEIFEDGVKCPSCGSVGFTDLKRWVWGMVEPETDTPAEKENKKGLPFWIRWVQAVHNRFFPEKIEVGI